MNRYAVTPADDEQLPKPITLETWAQSIAARQCVHSTRTDTESPCYDTAVWPRAEFTAFQACDPCTTRAVLAGRIAWTYVNDPPTEAP